MVNNKRIVLIGAGNVATHLGLALQAKGCEIVQVYSRTESSALELAERLQVPYTISLEEVSVDADLYIVAVKDAVLQDVIPSLVKGREDALFVHTAGSIPMEVWKTSARRYGVLYPMQTFSKLRKVDFSSVSFFVEASGCEELLFLKELALLLSPKVYEANSEQRRYLHLAAVFACNFPNAVYNMAFELMERNGLPFDAMLPLIDEAARKVHRMSPTEAQTGPARRGDENVMNAHKAMLDDELANIYEALSNYIMKRNR